MDILANEIKGITSKIENNIQIYLSNNNPDDAKNDLEKFKSAIHEALKESRLKVQLGAKGFDKDTKKNIEKLPAPPSRRATPQNDPTLVKTAYIEANAMYEQLEGDIKEAKKNLKQKEPSQNIAQIAIDVLSNNDNAGFIFNNTTNDADWSTPERDKMTQIPDIQTDIIGPLQKNKNPEYAVSTEAWAITGTEKGARDLWWMQDNAVVAKGMVELLQHGAHVPDAFGNDRNNPYFNATPDKNAPAQCGGRQGGPCYATSIPVIHQPTVKSPYCDMFGNEWEHALPAGQYSAFFGTPIFGTLQKLIEDKRDLIGNAVSENFSQTFSHFGQMALQDSAIISGVLNLTHKLFFLESAKVFNQAKCSKPLFLINSKPINGINSTYIMSVNSTVSDDIWKIMTTNNNYVCGAGNFVKDVNQLYIKDKNGYIKNLQNLCDRVNTYWSENSGFLYFATPDISYQLNNGTVSFLCGSLYSGSLGQLLGIKKSTGQMVANQVHNFLNKSYENRLRHIINELLKVIEEAIRQAEASIDQVIKEEFEERIKEQVDEAAKSLEDTILAIKERPEIEQKFREWIKANLIDDEEFENMMSANDDSYTKYERSMNDIEKYAALEEDKERERQEAQLALLIMFEQKLKEARHSRNASAEEEAIMNRVNSLKPDERKIGEEALNKLKTLPDKNRELKLNEMKKETEKMLAIHKGLSSPKDEYAKRTIAEGKFGTHELGVNMTQEGVGMSPTSGWRPYYSSYDLHDPAAIRSIVDSHGQGMYGTSYNQTPWSQAKEDTMNALKELQKVYIANPALEQRLLHCPRQIAADPELVPSLMVESKRLDGVGNWDGGGRPTAGLEDVNQIHGNLWDVKGEQIRSITPEEALIYYNKHRATSPAFQKGLDKLYETIPVRSEQFAAKEAELMKRERERAEKTSRQQKWKYLPNKYSPDFVSKFNKDGRIPQENRNLSPFEKKLLEFLRNEWYNGQFEGNELDTFFGELGGEGAMEGWLAKSEGYEENRSWPKDRRGAHLLRMKIQQIWIEVKQEQNQKFIQNKQKKINTYNELHETFWTIFQQIGLDLDTLSAETGIPQQDLYNYIITKSGAGIDVISESYPGINENLELMMNNFREIYSRKLKTPKVMEFITLDGANYSVKYLDDINKLSNTILEYIGYLNDSLLFQFYTTLKNRIETVLQSLIQRKGELGLEFTEEDYQKFISYIPLLEPIYKKINERLSKLKTENEKKIARGNKTKKDKLYNAIYKYLDLKIGENELPFLFNKLHAYELPLEVIEMGKIPVVNLKRDAESAELTEDVKNKKYKVPYDSIPYFDFSSDELDNISRMILEEKKKKEVEIPTKNDKYSKIEYTLKNSFPENMDINEDHILLLKKFIIQVKDFIYKKEKDEVSHTTTKSLTDAFDKIKDDTIINSRSDIQTITRQVSAAVSEPDDEPDEPDEPDESDESEDLNPFELDDKNKYIVNQIVKIINNLQDIYNTIYKESNKNNNHSVSSPNEQEILQLNKDLSRNFNITEEAKILDNFKLLLFEICCQIFYDNEYKKLESENKCEYPAPSNFLEGIYTGEGGGDIPEDTLVDITAIIGNTNKAVGYFLIMLLKSGSELNMKKVKLFLSNYNKFKNIEEQDKWEQELQNYKRITLERDGDMASMLVNSEDPEDPDERLRRMEAMQLPNFSDQERIMEEEKERMMEATRKKEEEERERMMEETRKKDEEEKKRMMEETRKKENEQRVRWLEEDRKWESEQFMKEFPMFAQREKENRERVDAKRMMDEALRKDLPPVGEDGLGGGGSSSDFVPRTLPREWSASVTAKYDNFNEYSVIDKLSLIWNSDKISVNEYNEINNYINYLIYKTEEEKISDGISGDKKHYITYFFNVIRGDEIFKLFTNEININDKQYGLPELYDTPIWNELYGIPYIWDLSYPGIYLEEEITTPDVLFKKGFVESAMEIKKKVIDLLYINLSYFIFDNIENNITFKKFKEIKKQNDIYYKRKELFEEYSTQKTASLSKGLYDRNLPHALLKFYDDDDYKDQMIMVLVDYEMALLYPNLPSPKQNSELTEKESKGSPINPYTTSEKIAFDEPFAMKESRKKIMDEYNKRIKNISSPEVEKAENNFEKCVLETLRLSMECMLEYYSHKSNSSGFSHLIVSEYHKADTNSDYLYRKYLGDNTYRLVLSYFTVKSIIKDKLDANPVTASEADLSYIAMELLPLPYKNINRESDRVRRKWGESIYSPLYKKGGAGEDEELKDIIETTIFHCIHGWSQLPKEGEEELGRGGIKDEIYGRFKDELYMVDFNFTKYLILLKDILENEAKTSGRSFEEFKGWIEREEMELLNKEAESEAKEKAVEEEARISQGQQRLTTVPEEVESEQSEDATSTPVQDTQMSSPLKTEGPPQEPKKAWEDDWRTSPSHVKLNPKPTEDEVAERKTAAEKSAIEAYERNPGLRNILFDVSNEAKTLKKQIEEARLRMEQPEKVKELEQKYEEARRRFLGFPPEQPTLEESSPQEETWGEWVTKASGLGNWLSGNKGKGGGKNRRSRKRTPKKQRRSSRKRTPKQRRSSRKRTPKQRRSSRKRTPKQRRSSRKRTPKQRRSSRKRTPKQRRSSRRRTPKQKRSLNKKK